MLSNSHLVAEIEKLQQYQSVIRSLVFLNCGGMHDLTAQWFSQLSNCSVYLIDYHRPFHHNNLIDPYRKIYIVDDGCKSFVEAPTEEDVKIF